MHRDWSPDQVRIIESGHVLEVSEEGAHLRDEVPVGYRYIDSGNRQEIEADVIRDRRYMAEAGFVVVLLPTDRFEKKMLGPPEVILRGVLSAAPAVSLVEDLSRETLLAIRNLTASEREDPELLAERIIRHLKRYLKKTIGKRPLIVPVLQRM